MLFEYIVSGGLILVGFPFTYVVHLLCTECNAYQLWKGNVETILSRLQDFGILLIPTGSVLGLFYMKT